MVNHGEVENHLTIDDANEYELADPLTPRRSRLAFELHHGIAEPVIFEDDGCAFFNDQAT